MADLTQIYKDKEVNQVIHFETGEDRLQKEQERMRQWQEAERQRQEREAENEKLRVRVKMRWEADDKKLDELQGDDVYTDTAGIRIPYEHKKKLGIFKRKETREEYRERVRNTLKERYHLSEKIFEKDAKISKQKIKYYENKEAENHVSISQVTNSMSEQQKTLQKKCLRLMAESESGRYEKDHPLYEPYQKFINAVKTYCDEKGELRMYLRERTKEDGTKSLKGDTIAGYRDLESDAFLKMKKCLAALQEQGAAADDFDLLFSLRSYEGIFRTLGDGFLKVPENAVTHRLSETYLSVNGTELERQDRRKEPLFAHEPSLSDVVQGNIGDCYLVSALGAMVSTEPMLIKESMRDNGDGTVTVRFFQPLLNFSETSKKTYQKTPMYITVSKNVPQKASYNALWTQVMEVAYAGYLRQKSLRRQVINEMYNKMNDREQRAFDEEQKEIEEKVRERLKEKKIKASELDLQEVLDWSYLDGMEKFIANGRFAEKYGKQLAKRLEEEEKKPVRYGDISGGWPTCVLSILTGRVHESASTGNIEEKRRKGLADIDTRLDKMNKLSFVFDDMLNDYFAEHPIEGLASEKYKAEHEGFKNKTHPLYTQMDGARQKGKPLSEKQRAGGVLTEDEKKIYEQAHKDFDSAKKKLQTEPAAAERNYNIELNANKAAQTVLRQFLTRYSSVPENLAKGDVYFKSYMTREQLAKLLPQAKSGFKGAATVAEILEMTAVKDELKTVFADMERIREPIEDFIQRIVAAATTILAAFVDHASEGNGVLNYERFSGQYSKQAEKTFQDIVEATNARKAVTASTFNMATDAAVEGEGGEQIFDGIASEHAYMVLGTKTVEEGDKTIRYVRVKNPWSAVYTTYQKDETTGKMQITQKFDSATDGVSEIELNDFMARFRSVTFAKVLGDVGEDE